MSRGKRFKSKRKVKAQNVARTTVDHLHEQQEEREEKRNEEISHDSEDIVPCEKLKAGKRKEKSSKKVNIAFLPDKYEPLVEDLTEGTENDEKSRKKQEKYKRLRKNVGKALRYSWKCLVAGLQTFSTGYSTPVGAVATLVPEIHRTTHRR